MRRAGPTRHQSVGVPSAQRPRSKIIQQNQTSGQILFLLLPEDCWKVCHFSKNKAPVNWREHVVLMTWENKTRPQLPDGLGESIATVRQRCTKNCKINIFDAPVEWCAGNASGIDINLFAGGFDPECERLPDAPVRRPGWSVRARLMR